MKTVTMVKLRGDSYIAYVGDEADRFPCTKLPTIRQVLCYFFKQNRCMSSRRAAAAKTIREVQVLWNTTSIPQIQDYNAITKLEKLYLEWVGVTKNPARKKNDIEINKVMNFTGKLDNLFDLSLSNAEEIMRSCEVGAKSEKEKEMWREEIGFFLDQKHLRVSSIGGIDAVQKRKETLEREKQARKRERELKAQQRAEAHAKKCRLSGKCRWY